MTIERSGSDVLPPRSFQTSDLLPLSAFAPQRLSSLGHLDVRDLMPLQMALACECEKSFRRNIKGRRNFIPLNELPM